MWILSLLLYCSCHYPNIISIIAIFVVIRSEDSDCVSIMLVVADYGGKSCDNNYSDYGGNM